MVQIDRFINDLVKPYGLLDFSLSVYLNQNIFNQIILDAENPHPQTSLYQMVSESMNQSGELAIQFHSKDERPILFHAALADNPNE